MEKVKTLRMEIGCASAAMPGQIVPSELHLVKGFCQSTLLAAVNGLGHGVEAAAAARLTISTLEGFAGQAVGDLMRRCHQVLRFTNGAVMSLAVFNSAQRSLTWLGVGTVEGALLRRTSRGAQARQGLQLRNGVVGDNLPELAASVSRVKKGDVLIFVTGGIRPDFADRVCPGDCAQSIADRILADHRRPMQGALVLVGRCLNGQDRESVR